MSNKTEFWNWAKGDLIQAIYDDEDPNYLPNKFSYILGTPTFRQLRLRTDSGCSSPKTLDRTKCTETFLRSKEERGDFVLGWNQSVDQTGVILTSLEVNGPWLYSTQSESGGTTWSGVVADYGSGGYVANFSKTPDSAILLLNELYSREWIDNFTSAVVFELYAFAPNVNLLSEVTFLVEFPPFGGLIVSKSISSIKLYHYISGMHLFALILEAIFIVYTVYFLIREAESIMREREQYFTNVWNIFDMATVVVSVASVVLFIVNYLESSVTVELYGSTRSVRFHKMFQVGNLIDFVMGMLICLGMIKFLHLLRFNPLIYKFGYVFRSLGTKILMFCLVLLCVMIAFSGLLFLLTRGQVRPFKSMTKCLETHFRALLGFFDYDPVRDFDSIWIPTLYIGYSFVATFCLYSLMIAMFLDGLNEVSRRLLPNEETALLWILIGKIKDWFGIKEHQTGKERPAEGKDPKWLEPKESFSDQTTSQARVTTSAATETGADASTLKGTNTASEGVQGTSAQSSLAQGADTATGAIQDTRTESSQGKTIDNASLRGTTYDALKSTSTTSDGPASTGAVQGTSPLQGSKTKSSAVQDARSSPAEDQHKTMPAKKDTTDSASNQQAPK